MIAQDRLSRLVADRFAFLCAIWLHLAVYALLAELSTAPTRTPSSPAPVEVEIIRPDLSHPGPSIQPNNSEPSDPLPRPDERGLPVTTGPPEDREAGDTWIRAETFLAASVLADPRSRQARRALSTLVGADRREQVCALEAMEQLRQGKPGFRPTRLAPHAFRNARIRDGMIVVTAGAVRSQRQWYEIAYRCRLDPEGRQVVGFEYALGATIERALWDAHGLAPVH
ncbi:DUF930 domain-containing protein [Labrenzia sp. VG12]|uniref:DUF930 domain-containing protein n=1 Tax=Labrenzia sp. VG12 TaxID=2021862 RepID=UPI0012FE4833|nr:DUF930 domain-containing protein [Labrenzia sp. VG12]